MGLLPTDTIVVKITGTFPHFYMNNGASRLKLIHVKQWGNIQWRSFSASFSGCAFLRTVDGQSPNLSNLSPVLGMSGMFEEAWNFNSDISAWDVSNVKNMSYMFYNTSLFNSDLSIWDVSNVTELDYMFYLAQAFNSDLSAWDVSSANSMSYMFYGTTAFNSDISNWNVSNVDFMTGMFYNANVFNKDISSWNVGSVISMSNMFNNASSFNQDLSSWNVNQIMVMTNIFNNANISYCNMDNILNAWGPTLISHGVNMGNVRYVSSASAAIRTSLGNRVSVTDAIVDPISANFSVAAPTTAYCAGEEVILTATGGQTYEWNGVEAASPNIFTISEDAIIIVKATDEYGCSAIETVAITMYPSSTVSITADQASICLGNETTITLYGVRSSTWNTQETSSEITVAPTETSTYSVSGTDVNGCSYTSSIEITVDPCLGIEENNFELSVYPNPASDNLRIAVQHIDFSDATITLMDMTGKVLLMEKVITENTVLSMSNYPSGIYFVKIQSGENLTTEKIIKQ